LSLSDLENKLNAILSDSNAMGQIMALARSLGGGQETSLTDSQTSPDNVNANTFASSLPPSIDPRILDVITKVFSMYNSNDDDRANLLIALRPFVRKERYAKLDQAVQISKITRALRIALDVFRSSEGGFNDV